jgi:hypothetical protein
MPCAAQVAFLGHSVRCRLPDDHLHVDGLKIKAGTSFSLGSIEIVQAEILIHFSYAYVFFGRTFHRNDSLH